jgi:hypothetical protein
MSEFFKATPKRLREQLASVSERERRVAMSALSAFFPQVSKSKLQKPPNLFG